MKINGIRSLFATIAPALLVCMAWVVPANAAIVVHTSDFIADGSRSNFNGFESIPNDGTYYTGGNGPYTEDSIQVEQINGQGASSIWVGYGSSYSVPGAQGNYSWYPSGGDNGYTQVSLSGGVDFQDVGLNYFSGYVGRDTTVLYDLLDNGSVVLSGSAALSGSSANYLGFSGGGFDTIRMRDGVNGGSSVTDGTYQALAIDNIETLGASTATPEPATMVIWGIGALGFGLVAARRRKLAAK